MSSCEASSASTCNQIQHRFHRGSQFDQLSICSQILGYTCVGGGYTARSFRRCLHEMDAQISLLDFLRCSFGCSRAANMELRELPGETWTWNFRTCWGQLRGSRLPLRWPQHMRKVHLQVLSAARGASFCAAHLFRKGASELKVQPVAFF